MTTATPWPADTVQRKPVAALLPYARNARTHSDAQVAQIAASIREWGWTTPCLVDDAGTLIAGHGRVLAARQLGLTDVPVMVATGWTDAQIAAYRLADNQLALNAAWDTDLLRVELDALRTLDFDLGMIGFSPDELAALLATGNDGLTDPDDVPETPAEPVTKPGDVWMLGRHRLMCGDSTSDLDVSLALAGVRPHLMVTDPPYGVNYDPDWRNKAVRADGTFIGARALGAVNNDDRADWREAWGLFPGDVAYVWSAPGPLQCVSHDSLVASGFEPRQQIIWVKQHFVLGRGHYPWQHEPCWYAVRKGTAGHWNGDRKQSSVWEIKSQIGWESARPDNKDKATGHSTQKPVECMRRPIENNSSPGQAVYDPFVGSGTTIIAAEMTGRAAHCIEISPTYCDVAVLRWQAFTGQRATHATTGEPFPAAQATQEANAA